METGSQDGGSPGRTSQLLVRMVSQLAEQMDAERVNREADREATQAQIKMLQEALSSSRPTPLPTEQGGRVEYAQEQIRPLIEHPRKTKPTLPDPPRYDGNRRRFRAWLNEIKNKLRVDGGVIGTKADHFAYIYSRLSDSPQQMTIAFVEAGGREGDSNPDDYLQYLEECYGDPNAKARAIERLRVLKQGETESFAALLPRFEKELADSGGAVWPEEVRISYLEGALNRQLRLAAVYAAPNRGSYSAWVRDIQRLSSGLEGVNKQEKHCGTHPAARRQLHPETRNRQPQEVDEDIRMTGINQAFQGTQAQHRSKDERRCYRCNRKGHLIAQCQAKAVFPKGRKDPPQLARVSEPEVSDEYSVVSPDGDEDTTGKD